MACIESNYEVNVARKVDGSKFQDGKARRMHFCKVELGSMLPQAADEKFTVLCKQFPAPEFTLQMTYWKCRGEGIASRGEDGIAL